ncbi:Fe-S cluster assembly protein SufD [Luteimonas sp. 22616]|uniref:Fe-S cluster assembly protein SufD n=1 Tax=Luteimonas sp. 22616 TaxID=3453951 RepID=UPI003F86D5C9
MSALLDSLVSGFAGDAARKPVLDAIVRDGLPGPRSEAWKYTPLRALERRAFAPVEAAVAAFDPTLLAGIPAPRLVFVNGVHDPAHSDLGALPHGVTLAPGSAGGSMPEAGTDAHGPGDEVFANLNAALARTGAMLRVEAGAQIETPLHLVFIGAPSDTDRAWHLRHAVEVGEDASLVLAEHHLAAGAHRHLDTATLSLRLAARARLRHARIHDAAEGATTFLRTDAIVAEDAEYRRLDLELGAALSRHELNVRLEGDRARLVANGVLLATGKRHLDTRLGVEHVARDTACELTWRGIGAGRGRAVFHGGITIHEGADGSDANLSNKNLLLSEGAEIDTQPVLVIHADEVKAAHGATVGQLDPTAMFYLRSRGLPETDARRLLTVAFVREPLGVVASDSLRAALEARLDAALASLVGDA